MTVSFVDPQDITAIVTRALEEDIGPGDLTAELVNSHAVAVANVIVREYAILCGIPWFNEVVKLVDPDVQIGWQYQEGETIVPNHTVCILKGQAKSILTAERTAINFLQTLSATATVTRQFVDAVDSFKAKILDTRKTIPGLRNAQKYAVQVGGGTNHRHGLYDGVLIKENHQYISKSLRELVNQLPKQTHQSILVEAEVENLEELKLALDSDVNRILLDNFSVEDMTRAVEIVNGQVALEASGNVNLASIKEIAMTGVDYISIGAITKNVQAIDFTMQFERISN